MVFWHSPDVVAEGRPVVRPVLNGFRRQLITLDFMRIPGNVAHLSRGVYDIGNLLGSGEAF